ncbi:family 43 glycosylhydrolase [Pelagicoccus mobilis]|uniref:Family 43 glycosylhydrolase n=1 Tax=Pelagicoccus mobilis TaxID=415221 RepID=A0A934RRX2_9BACT|nr:family 43 glycosylhydrolase [Pelagicoccus mobilis]MBK1876460.1 family 43 glycosylhydrolase [Pelagicoccus mobilis]
MSQTKRYAPPLPTKPISLEALQAQGVTDPQIRIFEDKAWLYASHDSDPDAQSFIMPDWQLWSSEDLVNWSFETTLSPEQTYLGKPFHGCWAGDAICKNGTYYWCLSIVDETVGTHEIALVSAPTPTGPWNDETGTAWINSDAADTHVYDPGFLQLDNGETYIVFGVWDYYIARLKDDMSGLAEKPRKVQILNPSGPYGDGKTDDKPFLHKHGDLYYLSWGCFYATSKSPYGPYQYKGCIIDPDCMEENFKQKTWPQGPQQGRHGSFFDWKGQSYFIYCDMSFSGNRYYRGSWISYLHYRENGEIAPIEINSDAVGRHSCEKPFSAANYSTGSGIRKVEDEHGNFGITPSKQNATLCYPNITGLTSNSAGVVISLSTGDSDSSITVSNGELSQTLSASRQSTQTEYKLVFPEFDPKLGVTLSFDDGPNPELVVHSLAITKTPSK